MKKSYARADVAQNRLHIKVAKKLTKKDLESLYTDIRFCVADLSPGFSVITDLSECTVAALSGLPSFRRISNFIIEKQVGVVVRVMNPKSILFQQFVNLTSRMQGYSTINVFSHEEAEIELAKALERSALRFHLHKQPVEFHTVDIQGAGFIIDISTSGCAIGLESPLPKVNEEIKLKISFNDHDNLIEEFETAAEVVKVGESSFAIRYAPLNKEVKEQLWQRLVHESKGELEL